MQASTLRAHTTDSSSRLQAASIENIASRMEYLIRTVVDTSMIETHRFIVVSGYCEVGALVDAAMEMFRPVAASKHIELEANVDSRELVIRGNREQVLEVLCNLVGNALKFTCRPPISLATEVSSTTMSASVLTGNARPVRDC